MIIYSLLFQVEKLVLIDASVYTEGTGNLSTLPKWLAYAGVSLLLYYPYLNRNHVDSVYTLFSFHANNSMISHSTILMHPIF